MANPTSKRDELVITYNRKEKSLGLLCSKFLSMYNREGVQLIGLDDAASKLGVERRRIYDITNILESVGVLARRAKNQYTWKGFEAIPQALEELKEEGLKEQNSLSEGNNRSKFCDDEDERYSGQNTESADRIHSNSTQNSASSSKPDNRREKSLGLLTQSFVKLFLCSKMDKITLEEAAKVLLGVGHSSTVMRTKVRRLYDIANVLTSMNLLERTQHSDSRRPALKWIGPGSKTESNSATNLNQSKKRAFGTDITNTDSKRIRVDTDDGKLTEGMKMQQPVAATSESLGCESDRSMGISSKPKVKSYEFGPFAPTNVPRARTSGSNVLQVHDWENLATIHRPVYQNPVLKELFEHYEDAWSTWNSAVAKQPIGS